MKNTIIQQIFDLNNALKLLRNKLSLLILQDRQNENLNLALDDLNNCILNLNKYIVEFKKPNI